MAKSPITSNVIVERALKDINPVDQVALARNRLRDARNGLSSRAIRRAYERAYRKMANRGML